MCCPANQADAPSDLPNQRQVADRAAVDVMMTSQVFGRAVVLDSTSNGGYPLNAAMEPAN